MVAGPDVFRNDMSWETNEICKKGKYLLGKNEQKKRSLPVNISI